MPEGMSCVSPGFSSSGASMQARRSTPAEPCVAYWGSGYSRPIRGSRMRTSRRRRAPWCAPSPGIRGTLRLGGERGLFAGSVALGDDLDDFLRMRRPPGSTLFAYTALCRSPDRSGVGGGALRAGADLVRGDHVE